MAKNKNLKRKPTPFVKAKQKETEEDVDESASEQEELNLTEVNDEGDSSDSENENDVNESSDDELSFESDDEGNYQQNLNKKHSLVNESDSDEIDDDDIDDGDDDDDDDDDEEDDLEGSEDEELSGEAEVSGESDVEDDPESAYISDDSEELSFEEDDSDGDENGPSASGKSKSKKPPKGIKASKQNGIASSKATTSNSAKSSTTEKPSNAPKSDSHTNKGNKQPTNAADAFKKELKQSSSSTNGGDGTKNASAEVDEYKFDTDDEEDIRNTVGNIPMKWYDEYKHIGYDWDAKKIIKPPKRDQLDDFLKRMEDPNFWRTVKDPQTGQDVILSEADIDLIKRINSRRVPDANFDDYAPWIEWFSSEVERMPIRNVPDHKRSFIPSVSEKKKVSKLVHAIKMGWMKSSEEVEKERAKKPTQFYMLWETDTGKEDMRRIHDHVSAPKRDLPGHAESYNPPPEYLFDEKEMREWHKFKDEPSRRKLHFVPQKFKSLREVPAYPRYVRERFLRCLDLYLCPRARRTKLTIDAEYLIPKLPSPKDLQPFPTIEAMVYTGHTDLVRTITVEPKGEFLASGSDDQTVKIWEIATGRCIKTIHTGDIVRSVAWCPNVKISLIAIASGQRLILVNPKVGDRMLTKRTDEILVEAPKIDLIENERIKTAVQWATSDGDEYNVDGFRLVITHFKPIKQVTWHGRGDYFATVMPEGANRSTLIHQLSKRRTQIPFSKSKGLVQCVLFHPVKPCLFVATQKNVRIYDLVKQELLKKLITNSKWISDMAIHPKGDNLLVSTYDKKMLWFDLDLSTKPYQTIRLHKNAVRSVAYHLRYPLFASASDDQSVIVSHGMVYNDLLQNPLIVPLKKLQTHKQHDDFGVFDVIWHPTQPWVFSSGADSTIRLFT